MNSAHENRTFHTHKHATTLTNVGPMLNRNHPMDQDKQNIKAHSRLIRPDDFEIIEQIPGIVAVARDECMKMFWCTTGFFRIVKSVESVDDMMGKTLHEVLSKPAADEREKIHRKVIETQRTISHYQFSADSRVVCTIFPLDEDAFGHRGILAIVKDAPVDVRLEINQEIKVLSTPNLADLNALTSRELEVLHYVAKSMSTSEIADHISRSPKTIDNHINSIHAKLRTHSRSQLVRYACERGIQSFSDDEWKSIISGSKAVNKSKS